MLVKKHELVFLFTLFFFIYNLNLRPIPSGDTLPAALLPFCVLEDHCVNFDVFEAYIRTLDHSYMFVQLDDHYLSYFPIVTPLLVTPFYSAIYLVLKFIQCPIDMLHPSFQFIVYLMEKLSASAITALSGIFVYLSVKELTTKKTGIISALIYGFGTNTWTISSQALWQHGMVELLLAAMIYIIIKNENHENKLNYIFLGLLSGLSVFNRPSDFVLFLPLIFYVFLKLNKENIMWYFASVFISSSPFLFYNIHYFGSFFGGYSNGLDSMRLSGELFSHFAGLLFSPNRGLFVYTPVVLLSVFGYLKIKDLPNEKLKLTFYALGPACLLEVMVYSSFSHWFGGWCYGPRFLTGTLPVLALFMGLYLNDAFKKTNNYSKWFKFGFIGLLIVWSLFVQFVGAFYYPMGDWDGNPNVDRNPERIWDWNDTQIMRSFNAGPVVYNPLQYFKIMLLPFIKLNLISIVPL